MWDKRDSAGRTGEMPAGPIGTPEPARGGRIANINIGPSIQIKGELQGDEDLTIDGRVEGKIELRDHNLTIGPNGKIKADLFARTIVVAGDVTGSAFAAERVEIAPTGRLTGDIHAPRITIADGAHFKGSVDMERAGETGRRASAKPESSLGIPALKEDSSLKGSRV